MNPEDEFEGESLWQAFEAENTELVGELLQGRVVDINYSKDGFSLLHLVEDTHLNLAEALLLHPDIDVNLRKPNGVAALHRACQANQVGVAMMLLRHPDIMVDVTDSIGATPLWYVARYGYGDLMKMLLVSGAFRLPHLDVAALEAEERMTAVGVARRNGHLEVVDILDRFRQNPEEARREFKRELGTRMPALEPRFRSLRGAEYAAAIRRLFPEPRRARATVSLTADSVEENELPFGHGDIVTILKDHSEFHWEVDLDGRKGIVPRNMFEELHAPRPVPQPPNPFPAATSPPPPRTTPIPVTPSPTGILLPSPVAVPVAVRREDISGGSPRTPGSPRPAPQPQSMSSPAEVPVTDKHPSVVESSGLINKVIFKSWDPREMTRQVKTECNIDPKIAFSLQAVDAYGVATSLSTQQQAREAVKFRVTFHDRPWWKFDGTESWDEVVHTAKNGAQYVFRHLLVKDGATVYDQELCSLVSGLKFPEGAVDPRAVPKIYALADQTMILNIGHLRDTLISKHRNSPEKFKKQTWKRLPDADTRQQTLAWLDSYTGLFRGSTIPFRLPAIPLFRPCKYEDPPQTTNVAIVQQTRTQMDEDFPFGQGFYFTSSLNFALEMAEETDQGRAVMLAAVIMGNPFPVVASDPPSQAGQDGYQSKVVFVDREFPHQTWTGNPAKKPPGVVDLLIVHNTNHLIPLFVFLFPKR